MEYDSSEVEGASFGTAISAVEDCIQRLERVVGDRYLQFKAPAADEVERLALWDRFGIKEHFEVDELESLLQGLAAFEGRDRPWFIWLKWLLWN